MTPAELIELLRELVEIESPSYSKGVRAVAERCGAELGSLGANVRMLDGDHLVAELDGEGEPLLLIGHTDTVWPIGSLARLPFRVEEGRAYGPGSYDMKGCLLVMLEAIRRAGRRRAVRVFLTADEEHGSRTARPLLEEASKGVAAALVVEPPSGDGGLKTARKGLGRFRLTVTGRAAHAGTGRAGGVSAIEELAHQVLRLHALNDDASGVSVNVGVVKGGTFENVVAAEAEALVDVRVTHAADMARLEEVLHRLIPAIDGASLSVDGGWTRPPLEPSPGSAAMFARAREHGLALGLDLRESSSGGGSDGNLVGALGVPVLDGLGAMGSGAHAVNEHVFLDSIPLRAELLARILEDPGL